MESLKEAQGRLFEKVAKIKKQVNELYDPSGFHQKMQGRNDAAAIVMKFILGEGNTEAFEALHEMIDFTDEAIRLVIESKLRQKKYYDETVAELLIFEDQHRISSNQWMQKYHEASERILFLENVGWFGMLKDSIKRRFRRSI